MKIICTRNVVIGGEHYEAGDKADVSNEVGIRLVNMGKAKADEAPAKKRRSCCWFNNKKRIRFIEKN